MSIARARRHAAPVTGFRRAPTIGVNLWPQDGTWPELRDAALAADRAGVDSLWTWDHLYAIEGEPDRPIVEAWTTLAAWAALTERIEVGLARRRQHVPQSRPDGQGSP